MPTLFASPLLLISAVFYIFIIWVLWMVVKSLKSIDTSLKSIAQSPAEKA
jgi:hypothetical protein